MIHQRVGCLLIDLKILQKMDIFGNRIKHYSQLFSSVYFDKLALIHTFAHMEGEDNGKEIHLEPVIL